jgi:PAS domain-containing protein
MPKGNRSMMNDLQSLLQLIGTPAYFFDIATHEILAVNQHFVRLMEYTEAELLSMTLDAFRPEEDLAKLRKALAQSPPEGSVEWRYCTRSGTLLYVQITYRNSVYYDKPKGRRRDIRLVVISKWDRLPTRTADELFG